MLIAYWSFCNIPIAIWPQGDMRFLWVIRSQISTCRGCQIIFYWTLDFPIAACLLYPTLCWPSDPKYFCPFGPLYRPGRQAQFSGFAGSGIPIPLPCPSIHPCIEENNPLTCADHCTHGVLMDFQCTKGADSNWTNLRKLHDYKITSHSSGCII